MERKNDECCPKFDPVSWNEKIIEWKNKKFIKDNVVTLFYIPLNFGQVMERNAKYMVNGMVLSESTSKWNMDVYFEVDKEIPGMKNTVLSGKYYCKVYEGNFQNTGEWIKDFEKSGKVKYLWYTTCPKCAKKYGKNYVVIFGEVK